jgi:thiol peroxidase
VVELTSRRSEMEERKGIVTFKGNPLTLVGRTPEVGEPAPDFRVVDHELQPVTLEAFRGRRILFNVVPSLDTPICSEQTRRFNQEASGLPEGLGVVTISCDLPFAQARFCGLEGIQLPVYSDYLETSFGKAYGVLIKELRLLARSLFVVDEGGKVAYVQIVPEVAEHPDYDSALAALKGS